MYFPFLRGKQFELLALREISTTVQGLPLISPIIEPIKVDTKLLSKAVQALIDSNINFNIILNTNIIKKDLGSHMDRLCSLINQDLCNYNNFQVALNINAEEDFRDLYEYLERSFIKANKFSLIHNSQLDNIQVAERFLRDFNVVFNIINTNKVSKRYYRNFTQGTVVSLDDPFNQQPRSVDYVHKVEEFFSDDYLFYKQEGYVGFSDYLTIGSQFSESGFSPYAVVIHITFIENEKIKIMHFVSDTNSDTNDAFYVASKYLEAVKKLIEFASKKNLHTKAIEEFKRLKDHYPGLGTVKKLSIMHHIELMYNLLK